MSEAHKTTSIFMWWLSCEHNAGLKSHAKVKWCKNSADVDAHFVWLWLALCSFNGFKKVLQSNWVLMHNGWKTCKVENRKTKIIVSFLHFNMLLDQHNVFFCFLFFSHNSPSFSWSQKHCKLLFYFGDDEFWCTLIEKLARSEVKTKIISIIFTSQPVVNSTSCIFLLLSQFS